MEKRQQSLEDADGTWAAREVAGCKFADTRHGRRLRKLLEQIALGQGGSMPWACQDWGSTKAAYRFLSNSRIDEAAILGGHFQATRERFADVGGKRPLLVLHDTTEFSYRREKTGPIGLLTTCYMWHDAEGRPRLHTLCGLLMHSSLVVTTDGVPLGLAAIKFWTRNKFKGTNALKRKINPTRMPIEKKESVRWLENLRQSTTLLNDPERCVHIGDRESDIFELFCAAQQVGTHFVVRTCVDRRSENATVAAEMKEVRVQGLHRIEVRDRHGKPDLATLAIRYRRLMVRPSRSKEKSYPPLTLTAIYATEQGTPQQRERIDWKLLTDLPVNSPKEAIEKLSWYSQRWKIETFHKILKSGCRAEESKLRTAERLVNLLAVLCVVGWRIFWMTMISRTAPKASPKLLFTSLELRLLDLLVKDGLFEAHEQTLSAYITKLAKLGGYLARANDSPPGNMVVWKGLSRLTDIELGATMAAKVVGN